ncbi:MAG: peptidyl-prolyl cis-trans isomerase [Azoarcus sp.]|jgi:peptidyl-prolyl cis-trans isomerase C|nr:peptidyl-prolyl cis-trans isomerase [Azoarcus sp.]
MKNTQRRLTVALIASLFALTGCVGDQVASSNAATKAETTAEPAAAPVATVNGQVIPGEYAEILLASQRAQGAQEAPNLVENIRKDLIRRAVLTQAAVKAGVDKQASTAARQDLARQNVLIQDYLQDWVKNNPPTDEELKKEYDTIKSRLGDKEYRARHVLVASEKEANDLIARLKKGAKFATLAKKSLDPGSKDRGGDLGWSNAGSYVPQFAEALVKLEKGKYTTAPVKTDFGYHVILLEDVRELQAPPFEEVKQQLQMGLQQRKVQEYIEELEKQAEVK